MTEATTTNPPVALNVVDASATAATATGAGLSLSTTPTSHANRRLDRTTVCLPIVHGSIAFYLGKKAESEFQSHQWTLYLRGPRNEDLSQCIQKVVFHLHASFAQPVREYTSPPFEVTEKGWGEFEAQIRIHWKDPNESMTMVTHGIKLHPPGIPGGASASSAATATANDPNTPVVSEVYDEVVFTDPNEVFFQQLLDVRKAPTIEAEYKHHEHFTQFSDNDDALTLLEAQRFLQQQLLEAKERLKLVDDALEQVDADLENVQEQHQQQQSRTLTSGGAASSSHVSSTPKAANRQKAAAAAASGGDAAFATASSSGNKSSPSKRQKQK